MGKETILPNGTVVGAYSWPRPCCLTAQLTTSRRTRDQTDSSSSPAVQADSFGRRRFCRTGRWWGRTAGGTGRGGAGCTPTRRRKKNIVSEDSASVSVYFAPL